MERDPSLIPRSDADAPPPKPAPRKKLQACSACGQDVSSEAKACPGCGQPTVRQVQNRRAWIVAALAAVFLIYVVVMMVKSQQDAERNADEMIECIMAGGTDC